MTSARSLRNFIVTVTAGLTIAACTTGCADKSISQTRQDARAMTNPVFPFEIPVSDMDRAKAYYESAFGYRLDSNPIWLNRGDSPLADFLMGWTPPDGIFVPR
jgi:hypothetical protein